MNIVGDATRFGFGIGPPTKHSQVRDVSIFINGTDVSRHDRSAYLPSYVGALQRQSDSLKRCLNFEKHAARFRGHNLTQIHNLLLHGDAGFFADESDWDRVANFHRFLQLNEPNTDPLAAFLIPSDNCSLCLTYQYQEEFASGFQRFDTVDGVIDLYPYDLIRTIEVAIEILGSETQQVVEPDRRND